MPLSFQTEFFLRELSQYCPTSHFHTPWKHQKIVGFLTFSGGIEMDIESKWANLINPLVSKLS